MTYSDDIHAWRQAREADLLQDIGWLTLAGLHWLDAGENPLPIPNVDGTITLDGESITLQTNSPVMIDGEAVQSAVLSGDNFNPTYVSVDDITFIIIERGGQYAVRLWDKNHPNRVNFKGRHWYDVQPSYRVEGTFAPHPSPRVLNIENTVGQMIPMQTPGTVTFELFGQQLMLEAFAKPQDGIWVIFKDMTSGDTTYGSGRFMDVLLLDDQRVILDFNTAYNPPCVFTPYATCPIPPKENHLPARIEAGEVTLKHV